jgi:hypothetical protein
MNYSYSQSKEVVSKGGNVYSSVSIEKGSIEIYCPEGKKIKIIEGVIINSSFVQVRYTHDYGSIIGFMLIKDIDIKEELLFNDTLKIVGNEKEVIIILKRDGKLRKNNSPLSYVMLIIPEGEQVKVLSKYYESEFYKVDYKGQIGYLNVLYFKASDVSSKTTRWNKHSIMEYWDLNPSDEIEGIYIRSRKIVNYNGFGDSKTYNKVSDEDFFILKQDDKYLFSSFSGDVKGVITKAVGSDKYFLSTNLKYWDIRDEEKILSMYLNNSSELVLEDVEYEKKLNVQGIKYTNKVVWSDKYSLVYKPKNKKP